MTTLQLRIDSFDRILSLLQSLLADVNPMSINRESISEITKTPSWMIARALLVLTNKGYILKKSEGVYQQWDGFQEITQYQLNEWVTAYNQNALEKSRQKKQFVNEFQQELNKDSTPLERAKESFDNAMAAYQFGFLGKNGPTWFTSLDEAVEYAQATAQSDGLERIDLVQRVGVVINKPVVTLFK